MEVIASQERWFLLGQKPKYYYLDSRLHGNDNFNGNPEVATRGIFSIKNFAYIFINRNIAMKQ